MNNSRRSFLKGSLAAIVALPVSNILAQNDCNISTMAVDKELSKKKLDVFSAHYIDRVVGNLDHYLSKDEYNKFMKQAGNNEYFYTVVTQPKIKREKKGINKDRYVYTTNPNDYHYPYHRYSGRIVYPQLSEVKDAILRMKHQYTPIGYMKLKYDRQAGNIMVVGYYKFDKDYEQHKNIEGMQEYTRKGVKTYVKNRSKAKVKKKEKKK